MKKDRIYLITYFVLGITGIALIGWGLANKTSGVFGNLLLSVGGVILGTSISMLIETFRSNNQSKSVLNVIQQSLTSRLLSEEGLIKSFRHKFHCYYNTEDENGVIYWNYYVIDFSGFAGVGRLVAKTTLKNTDGDDFIFLYEAVRRNANDPLVLFEKTENGNAPGGIHVYPLIRDYLTEYYGYSSFETWTGRMCISKTILSRTKLFGVAKMGRILDNTICVKLDQKWNKKIKETFLILPDFGIQNEK